MNPIRDIINEVLNQQDKKGMDTYGQTLADCDDNTYDWQNMALQELADGMQYLAKENLRLQKENENLRKGFGTVADLLERKVLKRKLIIGTLKRIASNK